MNVRPLKIPNPLDPPSGGRKAAPKVAGRGCGYGKFQKNGPLFSKGTAKIHVYFYPANFLRTFSLFQKPGSIVCRKEYGDKRGRTGRKRRGTFLAGFDARDMGGGEGEQFLQSTGTGICPVHVCRNDPCGNMAILKGDVPREYVLQQPGDGIDVSVVCKKPPAHLETHQQCSGQRAAGRESWRTGSCYGQGVAEAAAWRT